MITAICFIIIAWTVQMPLWASIALTSLSSLGVACNLVAAGAKLVELSRDE
jgi:predicted permease